jgi:hypothetical protein
MVMPFCTAATAKVCLSTCGHRPVEAGFVGNVLEDALNSTGRHTDGVMDSKVAVNQIYGVWGIRVQVQ